ncbi:nitrogen regulation protein NR(I), partial [Klebsiella pneumoniae]
CIAIRPRSKRVYRAEYGGRSPRTVIESELFGHEKGAFTGRQYRPSGSL